MLPAPSDPVLQQGWGGGQEPYPAPCHAQGLPWINHTWINLPLTALLDPGSSTSATSPHTPEGSQGTGGEGRARRWCQKPRGRSRGMGMPKPYPGREGEETAPPEGRGHVSR